MTMIMSFTGRDEYMARKPGSLTGKATHFISAEAGSVWNSGKALCGVIAGSGSVVLDSEDVTCKRCQKVLASRVRQMLDDEVSSRPCGYSRWSY